MSVELLAPAGSVEALDAAIGEGADAVYFGLKSFNARMRGTNFAWNQTAAAIDALHKRGKKAYITVNTVIQENEMEKMYRFLSFLAKISPDALIVQDLGVLKMLRLYFPHIKVHASTQMNIASSKAANIASRDGVSRVVLARELSLKEISAIYGNTNCELEVFVHGALCISESGLCLFSSYLGGKSANRGMCTQACRRFYQAECYDGKRAGYFFSPYDLQLIDVVPDLIKAGVASFKIEGRMKSAEYVAKVVKAYRYVIDNYETDSEKVIEEGRKMLIQDFSRSKTQYHIFSSSLEGVLQPNQAGGTGVFLGKIVEVFSNNNYKKEDNIPQSYIHFSSDAKLMVGDSIRIHEKNDKKRESVKVLDVISKKNKLYVLVAGEHKRGDFVYLIQEKSIKRYPHVLPKNLDKYRLMPKCEKLPLIKLDGEEISQFRTDRKDKTFLRQEKDLFPKGVYVQVSSLKNIMVLVSSEKILRPAKLIINLNEETKKSIDDIKLKRITTPFAKKDTIISLDPFVNEGNIEELERDIADLVKMGYRSFVLNNLAHIKILKNLQGESEKDSLHLLAGPYLYTFNRYAMRYLHEKKIDKFIPPIENSYKNIADCYLNKTMKANVLLTVFAYPALFRISAPLPSSYDFLYFFDKENIAFKAFSTSSSSFVLPEKPFSITHRVGYLKKNGFERFLIDLSHTTINAKEYRFILKALLNEQYIEDTSYFNWKEGFYSSMKE